MRLIVRGLICAAVVTLFVLGGCAEQTVGTYNTPPQATITLPAPDAQLETNTVTFAGTVQDGQDAPDELTVRWFDNIDPDTALYEGNADTSGFSQFTTTGLATGTHLITLQVTDTRGSTDEDSIEITVLTDPPLVTIEQPLSGGTFYEADTIVYEGRVSNADESEFELTVRWVSDIQGELYVGTSDGDGFTTFAGSLDAGFHVITLLATDAFGVNGQDTSLIEVSEYPVGRLDQDGDGFCPDGIDANGDGECDDLEFTGPNSQDCNDFNADVCPVCPEICDGIADNNCDGELDATDADSDGDGYSICQGDCDDANPFINPGEAEVCDGWDTNCDGYTPPDEVDVDGDGWFLCEDCDDDNDAVNPGVTEICDGFDNDCDGIEDNGFDLDGDGWSTCEDDCNDSNSAINPGATEICNDWDDDCDGIYNENADPTELGEEIAAVPAGIGEYISIASFSHTFAIPVFSPCPGNVCTSVADGNIELCENSASTSGAFTSPYDVFDAYAIDFDNVLSSFTGCPFGATLTVPAGHNYALQLYGVDDWSDPATSWELLDSSDNAGSGNESVEHIDGLFDIFSGSQDFLLVVLSNGFSDCPSAGAYTLNVTGF